MGDGDCFIVGVIIPVRSDSDRLANVPGRRAEGQPSGDGDLAGGGGAWPHRDRTGGDGGQHHGVGGRAALIYRESGRFNDDPGDLHGKRQHGRIAGRHVGVRIPDHPGQRDGGGDGERRAGQRERTIGVGQAIGKIAIQGIGQRLVAIAGYHFRQCQCRDGDADAVELVVDRGRAEGRHTHGVGDRDRHSVSHGDVAVAADRMVDGNHLVDIVIVHARRDGDGLGHVPVRRSEGQCPGDGDLTVGSDVRHDGDVAER